MGSIYKEVRHDYFEINETDGPWTKKPSEEQIDVLVTIDAWKTGDDNEAGEVVAKVFRTKSGDTGAIYCVSEARGDESVDLAISEALNELRQQPEGGE
jgi:hypothetical protein